jgi:photosystem II stability/assembly factor-like uncharacterized protein
MPSLRLRPPADFLGAILGLAIFAAVPALLVSGGPDNEPDGFPGKKPNDWFHLQRAYPGSDVPMERYRAALEQARAMEAAAGEGERGATLWQPAGPTNIMGRITCLTAHPGAPGRIFIGAAAGGVFRSTDDGVNWTPVLDPYGAFSMGDLATDPQDPDVIYAGTGEPNSSGDSYAGIGLLRSTTGGDSWEYLGLEESRHIGRVVVDPTNSNRIWVAATGALFAKNPERGIYRSDDAGGTWQQKLFVSDSTGAIDVAIDPSDPSVVYAAMWERIRTPRYRRAGGVTSGIWKSTDAGDSWALLTNGLPPASPTVGRIGLAVAPSQPSTVYAIYADDPGFFDGVYKSTNAGVSWARVSDGALSDLYSSFGWYFGQIRVDPANANRVFVLGVPIYRSTNGGGNWSDVNGSMHVDHHALWIDPSNPQRILEGNDGGLYRSTNGGSSWSRLSNLPITQFYAITIDNLLPQRLYGGTQDNGTPRTLTGALDDWQDIYFGDGFYCLVDPGNSNVIYAEYQYGGLGKSTNGGNSFNDATSGINGGDRRNWSTPVVMDPTNSQVLYYGTYRVYRTTNGAGNWSSISPDLTGGPGGGNLQFATVTTIAVARSNPATLYAGTDDARVWVTTNTGTNWTNVSAGLPNRWVTRVTVDPNNRDVAYVTLSGYKEDSLTPHVFRTTNRGAVWTDISGNLPDGPANDLLVDPMNTSTLYVGTDFGVYVTRDLGARWDVLGAGFPINPVHDLELHAPTRTLVAGTHGRSMLKLTLPLTAGTPGPDPGGPSLALAGANPFRAGLDLTLTLPRTARARVAVHDVTGRLVRGLLDGEQPAGARRIAWDGLDASGRRVAAGSYFVRLETDGWTQALRVTRIAG